MKLSDIRADYNKAYRILVNERQMREQAFANKPLQLKPKIAEIDAVLEILAEWKEELKQFCDPEDEQKGLFKYDRK